MLTDAQRERFHALQRREEEGALSPTEQAELHAFMQKIEEEEAVYLHPATERIRQERLQIQEQNKALQYLVRRKERLARRLERILALSVSERDKINAQITAILNPNGIGAAR